MGPHLWDDTSPCHANLLAPFPSRQAAMANPIAVNDLDVIEAIPDAVIVVARDRSIVRANVHETISTNPSKEHGDALCGAFAG